MIPASQLHFLDNKNTEPANQLVNCIKLGQHFLLLRLALNVRLLHCVQGMLTQGNFGSGSGVFGFFAQHPPPPPHNKHLLDPQLGSGVLSHIFTQNILL